MSVSQKMTKLQNAWKIGTFQNSEQFSKGGPLEKKNFKIFQNHSIPLWNIILAYYNVM